MAEALTENSSRPIRFKKCSLDELRLLKSQLKPAVYLPFINKVAVLQEEGNVLVYNAASVTPTDTITSKSNSCHFEQGSRIWPLTNDNVHEAILLSEYLLGRSIVHWVPTIRVWAPINKIGIQGRTFILRSSPVWDENCTRLQPSRCLHFIPLGSYCSKAFRLALWGVQ